MVPLTPAEPPKEPKPPDPKVYSKVYKSITPANIEELKTNKFVLAMTDVQLSESKMDVELDFGIRDQLGDLKDKGGTSTQFVIHMVGETSGNILLRIASGPYSGKFVQQLDEKGIMIGQELKDADWFELADNKFKLRTGKNKYINNPLGLKPENSALGFWPNIDAFNVFACIYGPRVKAITEYEPGYLEIARMAQNSSYSSSSSSSSLSSS